METYPGYKFTLMQQYNETPQLMDIDKKVLIEAFAKNFLLKERRERSLLELKSPKKRNLFINKLNHNWVAQFDMRNMLKLEKHVDDFAFVKNYLKIKEEELCYVISSYDDLDDKIIDFQLAFDESYGRGLATLIIAQNADKLYLETEIDYGQQNRFVGKIV